MCHVAYWRHARKSIWTTVWTFSQLFLAFVASVVSSKSLFDLYGLYGPLRSTSTLQHYLRPSTLGPCMRIDCELPARCTNDGCFCTGERGTTAASRANRTAVYIIFSAGYLVRVWQVLRPYILRQLSACMQP